MFGTGIARIAREPKLKFDEDDVKTIAEPAAHVASFYDVPVSPVTQAWIALASTIGTVYAAKMMVIKMEREAKKEVISPANVG